MNKKRIYPILYVLITITASVPLFCLYVMNSGDALLWLERIKEVFYTRPIAFYPSAGLISQLEGQENALDSNLWLLIPGFLAAMGCEIQYLYLLLMFGIQVGTLVGCIRLARKMFASERGVLFASLLYMTNPVRLHTCYDRSNLPQAIVWMLLPVLAYGLLELERNENRKKGLLVSALALAGIGYANSVMVLVLTGVVLLVSIVGKCWKIWLGMGAGWILYLPAGWKLARYLLWDGMEAYQMPLQMESGIGYFVGEFFTSYAYTINRPGMGLALITALLLFLWLLFSGMKQKLPKVVRLSGILGLIFLLFSLEGVPWELLQRVCIPFLRLMPLLRMGSVFMMLACAMLTIPAAYAMEQLEDCQEEPVRVGAPVIVFVMAIGIAFYLCNTLMYTRGVL